MQRPKECGCTKPTQYQQSLSELEFLKSIHNAALENNIKKVSQQLHNSNQYDEFGYSPLHYAAIKGNLEIVQLLVQNGGDVNSKTKNGGVTVLMRACIGGNLEICRYLVKKGALVNCVDNDGRSLRDICDSKSNKQEFYQIFGYDI